MKTKINKNPMIILCGGKGKRMGEITKKIPKPLLKIGKKTIIEHKIKYYQSKGVNKFIFCLGYKSKLLKKFLSKKIKNEIFDNAGLNAGILKIMSVSSILFCRLTNALLEFSLVKFTPVAPFTEQSAWKQNHNRSKPLSLTLKVFGLPQRGQSDLKRP